jgi:hypothetical protein
MTRGYFTWIVRLLQMGLEGDTVRGETGQYISVTDCKSVDERESSLELDQLSIGPPTRTHHGT